MRNTTQPEPCGSGAPQGRDVRKALPNLKELVHDIENRELLKHLLSALEKHKCLDSPVWKGKRSPWVKAFCDLYHPAGAWGANNFRSKLTMTSPSRYSFKVGKVEKIYEKLKDGCPHAQKPGIHSQLLNKLEEFMSKQKYYNDYMAACKMIAEQEVIKPRAERAPIPSMEINDNPIVSAINDEENDKGPANPNTGNGIQVMEKRAPSSSMKNGNSSTSSHSPENGGVVSLRRSRRFLNLLLPAATPGTERGPYVAAATAHVTGTSDQVTAETSASTLGGRTTKDIPKRSCLDENSREIPQKKRQRLLEENIVAAAQTQRTPERETDSSSVGLRSATAAVAAVPQVSPEQGDGKIHSKAQTAGSEITHPPLAAAVATKKIADSASDAKMKAENIQEKRDKLAKLLRMRKEEGNGHDKMSQSIKDKIDQLDESLMELYLL